MRFAASPAPKRSDSGGDPWWFPPAGSHIKPQSDFYRDARKLVPEMQASTFGKILGKPHLGKDTYTTAQVNRWNKNRAEVA